MKGDLDTIQIEVTTDCNLKCPGCLRTARAERGLWADRHMSAANFARLLDHLPPVRVGILNGTGEPMLNPEIAEIVGLARASGKFQGLTFNTNALARGVRAYQAVAKAGLSFLSVSVDSLDPQVAQIVRTGTKTEKLVERLGQLAKALPIPITITSVVSRDNRHELAETLAKLDAIGRFIVFLTEQSDVEVLDGLPSKGRSLDARERAQLAVWIEKLRPQMPNLELILTQPVNTGGARCPAPFRHPFVDVDGFLTPCCTLTDAHHYGRVSLLELDLAAALALPRVKAWRDAYAEREPAACAGCQHRQRD